MVTVIDMTTGELTYSSKPTTMKADAPVSKQEMLSCPTLGLQEVLHEPRKIQMPPELAGHAISDFLARFDG